MKGIFRLLVFLLLVGGWGLAALSLHVVRTPGQIPITLVTKHRLGIFDTWVDTTKWTLADVSKHPAVVEQLVRSGKIEAIRHVAQPNGGDLMSQITDALMRAPRESQTTQPSLQAAAHGIGQWFSKR
jgi:hypothetical protein